jgi:hypothetical protein
MCITSSIFTGHSKSDAGRCAFTSRVEIAEEHGSYVMRIDLKKECDVLVEAYAAKNAIHRTTLGAGHLSAGPFLFKIHERKIHADFDVIVVTLGGTESHTHRITRTESPI